MKIGPSPIIPEEMENDVKRVLPWKFYRQKQKMENFVQETGYTVL